MYHGEAKRAALDTAAIANPPPRAIRLTRRIVLYTDESTVSCKQMATARKKYSGYQFEIHVATLWVS